MDKLFGSNLLLLLVKILAIVLHKGNHEPQEHFTNIKLIYWLTIFDYRCSECLIWGF